MNVEVGAQTDVGRHRELNEDGYIVEEPLFAVADGMGGHRAGEVASRMALEAVAEVTPDAGAHSLAERVRAANRIVHQRASEDRELEGMGTTITALWIDGARARVAHVGDSRAYLLRGGDLSMITQDHTLVQRMVDEGKITAAEAGVHPQRSILTRALGVDEDVEVDDLTVDLRPDDRVLLCTDGLTSMLGEDRIADIVRQNDDPQAAADALVDAANQAGGQDNITVVVIDLTGDASDGAGADGAGATTASARAGSASEETQIRPRVPLPAGDHTPPEGIEPVLAGGEDAAIVQVQDQAERRPGADWRGGGDGERRRHPRRWIALVVAVVAALGVGAKVYVDRQWFVGVDGDHVAIFRGIPSRVLGMHLSTLVQSTDVSAAQAEELQSWTELPQGISVGDQAEAEQVVAQIRADIARANPDGTGPGPSPSPSASPNPTATPHPSGTATAALGRH